MSTTKKATAKKTVKKSATKKASAKKPAAKKAAGSKAPAAKKEAAAKKAPTGEKKLGKLATKVVALLAKKPMTRPELSAALDGAFIGSGLMGHTDPAKVEPNSLIGRGYAKVEDHEGVGFVYSLTAAGKKVAAS